MLLDEMFREVRSFEIFLLTDVTGIARTVSLVNSLQMLFYRDLGPAGEVAVDLWASVLNFIVVNPHMRLYICRGLPTVLAELTAEWFVLCVTVSDVRLESGGRGAGHITVRTLVVVHM